MALRYKGLPDGAKVQGTALGYKGWLISAVLGRYNAGADIFLTKGTSIDFWPRQSTCRQPSSLASEKRFSPRKIKW